MLKSPVCGLTITGGAPEIKHHFKRCAVIRMSCFEHLGVRRALELDKRASRRRTQTPRLLLGARHGPAWQLVATD